MSKASASNVLAEAFLFFRIPCEQRGKRFPFTRTHRGHPPERSVQRTRLGFPAAKFYAARLALSSLPERRNVPRVIDSAKSISLSP